MVVIKDDIALAVEGVVNRLEDYKYQLGYVETVAKKDEDPAVLSDTGRMPILIVVPIGKRADQLKNTMSGNAMFHKFYVTVIGYYEFPNVEDYIDTVRGYGYDIVDLFKGKNMIQGNAVLTSPKVDCGYFVVNDKIIHRFSVEYTAEKYT